MPIVNCPSCNNPVEFNPEIAHVVVQCPHCPCQFIPEPTAEVPLHSKNPFVRLVKFLKSLFARKNTQSNPPVIAPVRTGPRATPKQVAFLTYMGVPNAEQLTSKEASDLIQAGHFSQPPMAGDGWHIDRMFLYPELYPFELKYLENGLHAHLHAYVRTQFVGSSEKLTKEKVVRVIRALTEENAFWWHTPQRNAVFLERLKQVYPGCCDGHAPERTHSKKSDSYYQPSNKGTGCLVVLSLFLVILALSALLKLR